MEKLNIEQLSKEFDLLDEVEQWEFVLKHKDNIKMILDNDNTTFTFVDDNGEDLDDPFNYFSIKAWIGHDYGVRILLPLIGIDAECC